MYFLLLLVLTCMLTIGSSHLGVDLSVLTNTSQFSCLINNYNIEYAFVRVFRSVGLVDNNSVESIVNAHSAGVKSLSAYIFPWLLL